MAGVTSLLKFTLSDPRLPTFLAGRHVPFFCSPEWNQVLEEGLKARAAYYCLAEGQNLVAALAGVHLRFGPVRMFYANIPYGGLIGDEGRFTELVERLRPALRQEGVHETRIVRTSFDAFCEPQGYQCTTAVHHVLDLRTLSREAESLYPSAVMRNVRKARGAGVVVRPIASESEVDRLFDLYNETMRRNHAPATWTRGFLHAIYRRLVETGRARVLLATLNDEIVAGLVLIRDGETTYYFLGASDLVFSESRPNDALFYEAVRSAAESGCTTFDFMTSRPNDEGLIRFKEKWGGVRQPLTIYCDELSRLHARLWRWTQRIAGSRLGSALVRFVQQYR